MLLTPGSVGVVLCVSVSIQNSFIVSSISKWPGTPKRQRTTRGGGWGTWLTDCIDGMMAQQPSPFPV